MVIHFYVTQCRLYTDLARVNEKAKHEKKTKFYSRSTIKVLDFNAKLFHKLQSQ